MLTLDGVDFDWAIPKPTHYFAAVLVAAVLARLVHCALRAVKLAFDRGWSARLFRLMFWRSLIGFHPREGERPPSSDYGYTFILGVIELATYPILIATNAWTVVGAWIGLKALAQWSVWADDRSVFNLFLIGNALNVLISVVALTRFVTPA